MDSECPFLLLTIFKLFNQLIISDSELPAFICCMPKFCMSQMTDNKIRILQTNNRFYHDSQVHFKLTFLTLSLFSFQVQGTSLTLKAYMFFFQKKLLLKRETYKTFGVVRNFLHTCKKLTFY